MTARNLEIAALAPFVFLLVTIAVAPLAVPRLWHRFYRHICAVFALGTATCAAAFGGTDNVVHAALDYASFIIVVGAFYVVAAGVHIELRGSGRPLVNTLFLLAGGLLANVIGTVGASMLLIRPWIAMNRDRFAQMHLAFFVFTVSNIGGALLPVGPPLFLGYQRGVPFFWPLQRCLVPWLVTFGLSLGVFYLADSFRFRKTPRATGLQSSVSPSHVRFDGAPGAAFLGILLVALIAAPPVWREGIILVTAVAAYFTTPRRVHTANAFTFRPLIEVAWIFLGIFGTMIPVLDYMQRNAGALGLRSEMQFFWATGILSALLDNAPTYLTFLAGALGLHQLDLNSAADVAAFARAHESHLIAISLGASFFGALTYIGNGPNLLVKAIAEESGMRVPGFFGFTFRWAVPVLVPIFVIVSLIFFR